MANPLDSYQCSLFCEWSKLQYSKIQICTHRVTRSHPVSCQFQKQRESLLVLQADSIILPFQGYLYASYALD